MALQWDVQSIKDRVTQRLQSKASWADILTFSTNSRLIDAFSEELSDLANYDEYLTRETKWDLARNRSSLLSMQSIHRYLAHRKIGSSGYIRIGISDLIKSAEWSNATAYTTGQTIYYNDVLYTALQNSTNQQPDISIAYWSLTNVTPVKNIDIPKWTVFQDTTGNYKFTSYISEALTTSNNFIDVSVVQGIPKNVTYTASGIEKEEFILNDNTIESYRYELYVNNVLWTRCDSLLEQTATATVYEIENKIDFSGIYIKFGDDINGKKLSIGDIVKFYYVSTSGYAGNINSANIVTEVNSTIYDVDGGVVDIVCSNREALLGGTDEEELESIRVNAPNIFETGDRASNISDYEAIILQNASFVSKVSVWGAYEISLDNNEDPWNFDPLQENVVHVAAVSSNNTNLTDQQKYDISTAINTFKAPTDIVTYETVRFVNLIFTTVAYVSNTTYTLSGVVGSIRSTLISNYAVSNMDLFENIYFSDYQTLIDQVSGVDHHTTYAELYYDSYFNDPISNTTYSADPIIPSSNLKDGSVKVYLRDSAGSNTFVQVAINNGSSFTPVNSSEFGLLDLTGSSINLSTGTMALVVVNDLYPNPYTNYTIRIQYRLNQDDLLLQARTDIFSYQDALSNISAVYIRR